VSTGCRARVRCVPTVCPVRPRAVSRSVLMLGSKTSAQPGGYGHYLGAPSTEQLSRYFHLDDADRERVNERRGGDNKLGFAVQMTTVRICAPGCCTNALVPTTASCSATSVTRRNASGTSVPPSSTDGAPTSWSIRLKAVYGGASARRRLTSAPRCPLPSPIWRCRHSGYVLRLSQSWRGGARTRPGACWTLKQRGDPARVEVLTQATDATTAVCRAGSSNLSRAGPGL